MSGTPSRLRLLIAIVCLAGAAALAGTAFSWQNEDGVLLLALVTLAVVSEVFDFSPFPNSRVSLSIAFVFAAALISGLPGVAVVASAAATTDYFVHRKPLTKSAYNQAVIVLSGMVYVGLLEATSPLYDDGDWIATLGPALAGSAFAFGVNSSLIALAVSLERGADATAVWRSNFAWLLPHFVLLGALAVLLAAVYDRWELAGLAIVLVPLAMAWLSIKQYADRIPHRAASPIPTGR